MTEAAELYRTLSLQEAADYLRVHPETLRQRALSGKIRGAKPGRAWVFLQADLVDYLRAEAGWRSTDAAGSGTSMSRSVDDEYSEVLGLPTGRPPKNTTTASRSGSGGRRS